MFRWISLVVLIVLLAVVGCDPAADQAPGDGIAIPTVTPTDVEPTATLRPTETPTPTPTPTETPDTAETPEPTETPEPNETPEADATPEPEAAATPQPTPANEPAATPEQNRAEPQVEVVATGLTVPWALAFAPDGRIFVTERGGNLRVIENGELRAEPVGSLSVQAVGEGGLMGLALDPDFADNQWLYVMYTYAEGAQTLNRISRFTLAENGLTDQVILVDAIPGARIHNGGRLIIGPDGTLYATTGDAAIPSLAQDMDSLAGKILRLNTDGSVPDDNPFPGSYIYSLGHRNAQGLTFQPGTDVLFSTEHGPTGDLDLCCRDELNRIVPGGNYGWPYVSGTDVVNPERAAELDLIDPIFSSGLDTWAPAGAAFYDDGPLTQWQGDLFFGGLRGRHIRRVELGGADDGEYVEDYMLYTDEYGRIRAVAMGPDGYLYFTTSNRDGRGSPAQNDDRVLRIGPAQ